MEEAFDLSFDRLLMMMKMMMMMMMMKHYDKNNVFVGLIEGKTERSTF